MAARLPRRILDTRVCRAYHTGARRSSLTVGQPDAKGRADSGCINSNRVSDERMGKELARQPHAGLSSAARQCVLQGWRDNHEETEMKESEFVQGTVSLDTKKRFEDHPGYRGKTQKEFVGEIVEQWLRSPDARLAQLDEQVADHARQIAYLQQQADRMIDLEARVRELGKQVAQLRPSGEPT